MAPPGGTGSSPAKIGSRTKTEQVPHGKNASPPERFQARDARVLIRRAFRACGNQMRMGHHSHRTVTILQGVTRLTRHACIVVATKRVCASFSERRPEEEGNWALPRGEFGLDVIAFVGMLRSQQQRSIPQIHEDLLRRGLHVAQRTVTDQLYRYEELVALHLADSGRLKVQLSEQKQVILAFESLPV